MSRVRAEAEELENGAWAGMVIGNDGADFCVGANLARLEIRVVLDEGCVVGTGTHEELIAAEGRYFELYRDWASQAAV